MSKERMNILRTESVGKKAEATFLDLGKDTLMSALQLRHVMSDRHTPPEARVIIKSALMLFYSKRPGDAGSFAVSIAERVKIMQVVRPLVAAHIKPMHVKRASADFLKTSTGAI